MCFPQLFPNTFLKNAFIELIHLYNRRVATFVSFLSSLNCSELTNKICLSARLRKSLKLLPLLELCASEWTSIWNSLSEAVLLCLVFYTFILNGIFIKKREKIYS